MGGVCSCLANKEKKEVKVSGRPIGRLANNTVEGITERTVEEQDLQRVGS